MLKLFSLGYTNYDDKTELTDISESGRNFINELEAVLEIEAISREKRDMVAESEKWPWFTVETL